jgi:uncharacterized protein YjbI with pentapeptide repeats
MHPDIWSRLCRGESLKGLGIAHIGHRLDLRNSHLPEARVVDKIRMPTADFEVLGETTVIRAVAWHGLDLSKSHLPNIRFMDCLIEDCVFDRCRLTDLRVWGTRFRNVSFRSTYLRYAALGGVDEGKRNSFHNVDFTLADMRRTAWDAAEFVNCTFKDTKLNDVDFDTSTFTDCTFEGELREVTFNRVGFRGEAYPPNEMKGVDFSGANLRDCTFRGLELKHVRFSAENQLVISQFPEALARLRNFFGKRTDLGSQQMTVVIEHDQKWLAPGQEVGVLGKDDIRETIGEEGLQTVIKLIEPFIVKR